MSEHIIERHAQTLRKVKAACDRLVPHDQRYCIFVYDGPEIILRDLSYVAPDATDIDVKLICQTVHGQIDV